MPKDTRLLGDQVTADPLPRSPGPKAYAIVLIGETGSATYRVPSSGSLILGRSPECSVPIDDASISRKHAAVHAGDPPTLEDLGSRNGTRALGHRLAPGERHLLATGTSVELGNVVMVIQRVGPGVLASTTAPSPPIAPGVIVQDPRMQQLYRLIDVIAPSDMCILILGETGVGKEVFADTVHKRSARAEHAFLRLNCAALSESLLESELFGYEKGAFTGAMQSKPGLFESADRGTVFLDEVGDMPLATQAKLLRVLENGEVMRVGSVRPRKVDVRFVAATNHDLETLVAAGRFRADLFFRLNGVAITIPPLRDRASEILTFADLFATTARRRIGKAPLSLSSEATAALLAYGWPGNIRELRNVIERAALLSTGPHIAPDDLMFGRASSASLPPSSPSLPSLPAAPVAFAPAPGGARISEAEASALRAQMETFERQRVVDALEQCAGNQSRAAERLGISRRALLNKLDAFAIPRPRKAKE